MSDRPEIVCICGSTRFADEMARANRDLTFAGAIVLAPGVFLRTDRQEITDEQKAALDELHLRKIDLADRVLVIEQGRVAHDINIDIPRPRRRGSADLAELEGSILRELLQSDNASAA